MRSPSRRWVREQPLSSVTSCLRRALCSRRHSLWILLVLVLVCIAFQTFVARQARTDKQSGLPHLQLTVNKPQPLSLENILENLWSNPAYTIKSEFRSLHTDKINSRLQKEDITKLLSQISPKQSNKTILTNSQYISENQQSFSSLDKTKLPTFLSKPFSGNCKAKTHIVFLKTHKTASSTILNILYRFGESRKLNFALPLNKHSQLFYPFFFASHFVEGVTSRQIDEFHIMCNHMRFRKSQVSKVMPRDTFYFSILRHPVSMMESIFIYYKSIPAFHGLRTLDDFFNSSRRRYNTSIPNNHYAHNILAFDFGFDNNVTTDSLDLEQQVSNVIYAIERDFNLILISEYFDESMVLLRHSLCWSLEDIVSFKLNSRNEQTRRKLSPETTEKVKNWNALDWRIYLHFNATFWRKIETIIGRQQLEKEVYELKALQTKLANICLKDGGAVDPSKIKDAGLKPFQYGAAVIQGYNLNSDLDAQTKVKCEQLITPELQYTDRLYLQQFPEKAQWHKEAHRSGQAWRREHRHFIKRRFTLFKPSQSVLNALNKTSLLSGKETLNIQ